MSHNRIDVDHARQLQAWGLSAAEMAERLGVTPRSVHRWRGREGIAGPFHGVVRVPAERLEAARRFLEDGASREEAALSAGVSVNALRRHFPDMKWSHQEIGQFARAVRRSYEKQRKAP